MLLRVAWSSAPKKIFSSQKILSVILISKDSLRSCQDLNKMQTCGGEFTW